MSGRGVIEGNIISSFFWMRWQVVLEDALEDRGTFCGLELNGEVFLRSGESLWDAFQTKAIYYLDRLPFIAEASLFTSLHSVYYFIKYLVAIFN